MKSKARGVLVGPVIFVVLDRMSFYSSGEISHLVTQEERMFLHPQEPADESSFAYPLNHFPFAVAMSKKLCFWWIKRRKPCRVTLPEMLFCCHDVRASLRPPLIACKTLGPDCCSSARQLKIELRFSPEECMHARSEMTAMYNCNHNRCKKDSLVRSNLCQREQKQMSSNAAISCFADE